MLLSPALFERAVRGGILRTGVWHAPGIKNPWPVYNTLTAAVHQASDHAAIWAELQW